MHGLILRTVQHFVIDLFGAPRWRAVISNAGVEMDTFESMMSYDDDIADAVFEALKATFDDRYDDMLEDLGTYLVSHPHNETVRRLLRFSGATFEEFLFSLDDLPGRVRLAIPDLDLPALELRSRGDGVFTLNSSEGLPGYGRMLVGLLRTMADDYGALVMVEHTGSCKELDTLEVTLLESTFAAGRSFDLGAVAGGA